MFPTCTVCKTTPIKGKAAGIFLAGGFICNFCEQKIIKTEVFYSEYSYLIEGLKDLDLIHKAK